MVLKDGSEISGMVEQDGAAVFDTARIFDQPWTITENREGLLRAQLTQSYEGSTLECTTEVNWTLPTTHDQPLQLGIEQKTKRDGVVWRNGFSVLYLSYIGRVLPRLTISTTAAGAEFASTIACLGNDPECREPLYSWRRTWGL